LHFIAKSSGPGFIVKPNPKRIESLKRRFVDAIEDWQRWAKGAKEGIGDGKTNRRQKTRGGKLHERARFATHACHVLANSAEIRHEGHGRQFTEIHV
jgi:hypothetical protein